GEGKTSFLLKAQSVASAAKTITCLVSLEPKGSKDDNLRSIMEKLLDSIDSQHGTKLRHDWKAGNASSFRVPKEPTCRVDDLINDLQSITKKVSGQACLICVDDG